MYEYVTKIRCELVNRIPMQLFYKATQSSMGVSIISNRLVDHLAARLGRI